MEKLFKAEQELQSQIAKKPENQGIVQKAEQVVEDQVQEFSIEQIEVVHVESVKPKKEEMKLKSALPLRDEASQ